MHVKTSCVFVCTVYLEYERRIRTHDTYIYECITHLPLLLHQKLDLIADLGTPRVQCEELSRNIIRICCSLTRIISYHRDG